MARWAPQKTDTLDALAGEILHNYGRGRTLVAVDGVAGTGEFASDLADALRRAGHQAFVASIDDFRRPRELRYAAGSDPASGRDLDLLRRVLIDPFRDPAAGSFVLAAYDAARDLPIEPKWMSAKPDAILIIEGTELQSPELRTLWHYTVWVESPAERSAELAAYIKRAKPSAAANAIVDASDPQHPRRVFADSC